MKSEAAQAERLAKSPRSLESTFSSARSLGSSFDQSHDKTGGREARRAEHEQNYVLRDSRSAKGRALARGQPYGMW